MTESMAARTARARWRAASRASGGGQLNGPAEGRGLAHLDRHRDGAAEVLKHLPEREIEALSAEMASLWRVKAGARPPRS